MASKPLADISHGELQKLDLPREARITNVKHLSSYNWVETGSPTIVVPGTPAKWSPPKTSRQLIKDSGMVYIAQNAARHPESPMEPLFRALYISQPSFNVCSASVVTDRNNLRKLLSFIDPAMDKREQKPFTINVHNINNGTILSREETVVQEFIGPDEFRGYGRRFESEYTTQHIRDSTGHHRVISYQLGDLSLIVRHETDGYDGPDQKESELDNLSSALDSLSLSSESCPGSRLKIIREGYVVPIESVLEIKTRVAHKPITFEEVASQLWVSQTTKLVRAYHTKGRFPVPVVEDVGLQLKGWEERNQSSLRKLAALIKKIMSVTRENNCDAVVCYDDISHRLIVRKADLKSALPNDLLSKWNDMGSKKVSTNCITAVRETKVNQNMDANKTAITIGRVDYEIDISRIPYLLCFVESQQKAMVGQEKIIHEEIPHFEVALKGIESGFRQCFRSTLTSLDSYQKLCSTYEFLSVDVLQGDTRDEIIQNLKVCKLTYDIMNGYHAGTKNDKRKARDAAFKLLYVLLVGQRKGEDFSAPRFFDAVLFTVSHPKTFRRRTRTIILAAFVEIFGVSAKQRVQLDRWQPHGDKGRESSGTDGTTEEETFEDYYDSDDSFW